MLEGLMQHDHPLTLQHVLERMRGMYGDGEVVTLTEDGIDARHVRARSASASTACAGALKALGVERGRPRGDVRVELAAPPRGLPRGARAWAPCCTR